MATLIGCPRTKRSLNGRTHPLPRIVCHHRLSEARREEGVERERKIRNWVLLHWKGIGQCPERNTQPPLSKLGSRENVEGHP
ncbi:hypothetical protein CDAR_58231 [Caerostris darwini]|uniref:Uncharacterized protein n=1 Tax=Caerostris darwini TaxID=1538125 RepID=A0AAV4U791_9ARAC|nr:hypothetical protein CDAR_58231 [Caerostris darwini]